MLAKTRDPCTRTAIVVGAGFEDRINQIIEWSEVTETGDRAELEFLSEDNQVWQEIDARSGFVWDANALIIILLFVTRLREEAQQVDGLL